jgi:Protein of unknown function (DUF1553)/Protein of unknown function (DUF1549)/Concanavalin A-like lectin/glucanases superfamily/Planctomycete cytochrome C
MRQRGHWLLGSPALRANREWSKIERTAQMSVLVAAAVFASASTISAGERTTLQYNRDVRPILAENCFPCHGPDSAARKADLRLDKREAAVKAGAIAPGDLEASELFVRITAADPKEVMPPPSTTKTLSQKQKDVLKRWIAEGATYQLHWSYIPPTRAELPKVKNRSWVRNSIDGFVLAKLEENGLSPAPEADRRSLARRLTLDLTGLSPDPADVEAFVLDRSPDAYEKIVSRLLASPRWGEHRARYWLDAARYADTNGFHFDNFREAWAYRDWLISAYNRNLSYDRFTVEQLAGDLLPGSTLEQQVASGFNRCNMTTNEGGSIPEEYQVLYTRDRTETVSQVWLGLTAGCAVCHDHKFDPITQREFYELSAFFNNTTQPVMDGNIKDTPPTVLVPSAVDKARWQTLPSELAAARKQLDARKKSALDDFTKWLAATDSKSLAAMIPSGGVKLATIEPGAPLSVRPDKATEFADAGDFERDHAFSFGAWVKLPRANVVGSILARMDDRNNYRGWDLWVENGRIASHLVNQWPANAVKVVTKNQVKPGVWTHVFITYDGSSRASGIKIYLNGEPQSTDTSADSLSQSIRTPVPLKLGQRHTTARVDQTVMHSVRLYDRVLSPKETGFLAGASRGAELLKTPAGKRSSEERDAVFAWWVGAIDPASQTLRERLARLEKEEAGIKARSTVAHVMHERREPAMAHLLFRGEYDKRRDPVKPDTPDVLPAMPPDLPRNRLGLARWLVRPDQPLTARVEVNRLWQEIFGTGLVRTTGDFGVSGELPTHPELLDYLALEFQASGWDLKRLARLIVNSATYRQSAAITEVKREKDPHNRLLSRGPRFRMDAEMIRDVVLSSSGTLAAKVGGPSVKPYQPEGVWEAVAMPESNTHFYRPDHGDRLYRRGLYTLWKRSAPPASLDIFHAPSREVCTVRRERTNTPLQALVTLNDPQFVEAARALAQAALARGGEAPDLRIDYLSRRLLARSFRPEELAVLRASLDRLNSYYQSNPDEAVRLISVGESKADPALAPSTLAAWTMLANELMNLDEFLNK